MQLGTITYNIAKDWDLPTLLKRLAALHYEGVELRTTHAHKVEVGLNKDERKAIKKMFADSSVALAGLGVLSNTKRSIPRWSARTSKGRRSTSSSHDLGSPGVKVRPNGIPKGADLDATLRRIGRALHEVGEYAEGFGVEIRVEVHGAITQLVPNLAKIIAYADHPNVYVCWNSNPTDVVNGSIRENFALVAPKIREVHLRDLFDEAYPWTELFALLTAQKYDGFTLAEIPESSDPERVLRYFRALWLAYQPQAKS